MPFEFWQRVIERTPTSAAFTWLTQPPSAGKVCRLEEWAINEIRLREARSRAAVGNGAVVDRESARIVTGLIDELRGRMRAFDEDYGRD